MPTTYLRFNAIELKQKIGHGNVSVFKATMAIAVKKMDCHGNEVPREVKVHSKLPPHPNVLPLLGVAQDGDTLYICMELADKSLYDYLHIEKKKLSFHQKIEWAKQIASGMHHIHKHGLAHCDLKSANVLLFEAEGVTKVCDFGSAQPLEQTATVTGMMGTYRWMAPEFQSKASTKANQLCDVFSYGMVLYEIFMQQVPFASIADGVAVIKLIQDGKRPSISAELPLNIKMLIQSCWEHTPHIRPRFDKILQVGPLSSTADIYSSIHVYSNKEYSLLYITTIHYIHKFLLQILTTTPTSEEEMKTMLVSTFCMLSSCDIDVYIYIYILCIHLALGWRDITSQCS